MKMRSLDKKIRASIVIRTYNEEEYLGQTLTIIFSQSFKDFEVIIVDSESTDSTLEIARKFPVIIKEIKKKDFTYGHALNVGAEMCNGEFLVFLSAHSVLYDIYWLENLLKPFEDNQVTGVCGKQVLYPHSQYSERLRVNKTFNRLEGSMKSDDFVFSNSNSAILKDAWCQCKFDEIIEAGEDQLWARLQMARGKHIYFQPSAQVYHSHHFTLRRLVNKATNDYLSHLRLNNCPIISIYEKLPSFFVHLLNSLYALQTSIIHFINVRKINILDFWDYYRTNFIYRYVRYKINRNFLNDGNFLKSEETQFSYEK